MAKQPSPDIDHETCIAYHREALSARRAAQVRVYLAAHPDRARQARIDAENEQAIAQSFVGVLQEPIPARLAIERRPATQLWSQGLGFAAVMALSGTIGWWLGAAPPAADPTATFTQRVVSAAQQPVQTASLQPVANAGAAVSTPPPDMSRQGFHLIRRRHPDSSRSALTEFVYRNDAGQTLRMFAESTRRQQTTPTVSAHDGIAMAQWRTGNTRYALVGNLPELSLRDLAQTAQADTAADTETPRAAARSIQPMHPANPLQPIHGAQLPPNRASTNAGPAGDISGQLPTPEANETAPALGSDGYTMQPTRM